VVVPDDARELEADRQAWLREERRARWRARARRLLVTRSGRPRPVALLATLLVAILGTTTALAGTVLSRPTDHYPMLATPAVAPGRVGGLLPETLLQSRGGPLPSRRLRPAALLLLARDCQCADLARAVARAAHQVGVSAVAVSSDAGQGGADRLGRIVLAAGLEVLIDPGDRLRRSLVPPLPTQTRLLLVQADGVLDGMLDGTDLTDAVKGGLEVRLAQLGRTPAVRPRTSPAARQPS
jgi:hypothetical protein